MPTKVFIQPEGAKHVFRRPGTAFSLDNIVERPQRLRAVNCGLAAGLARLEALQPLIKPEQQQEQQQDQSDDLIKALKGLALGTPALAPSSSAQPSIVFSAPAPSGLIRSKAVEFVHHPPSDDPEEVRYLDSLVSWVKTCEGKWAAGESEIPAELPQLDLYLCRTSLAAVEGALSTTIQAVDAVVADSQAQASTSADVPSSSAATAFCAIRPPGHHCGEDNPMGFCFVNNVAVGAAHAYLRHGIDRVVILDIDLHHGNGTQEIALRLNEDTYREELLVAGGKPAEAKRGLKVFYGSVHDIYSFPCEDGNLERVKDASLNLAAHGQYIENVHLLPYTSPADFWARCYPLYTDLFARSARFLDETAASPERTLILVSAGFDACEHEGAGMQRHGGNVPVGFYERFHRDTVDFAVRHAKGRVVSVLEGGYGDRALASGAMASVVGLSALPSDFETGQAEEWWSVPNLVKLEKALKRPSRRTTRVPIFPADDAWLQRTTEIFAELEAPFAPASMASSPAKGTRTTAVRTGQRMMTRTRSADKSLSGVLDSRDVRPSGTNTPKEIKEEPESSESPALPLDPASENSAVPAAGLHSPTAKPSHAFGEASHLPTSMPAVIVPAEPTFAHLPPADSSAAPPTTPSSGPVVPRRIILKIRNPLAQPTMAAAQSQPSIPPFQSTEPDAPSQL